MAGLGKLPETGKCSRTQQAAHDEFHLGQMSLLFHSVLIFPREKAEHQREAAPGFDPWHYLDLDYPAFTKTADKIKH